MKWRLLKLDWRYAIGELLIVVLGVMIALYADQWNSLQTDKQNEIEYIERLIADLREDQRRIDIATNFINSKMPSLDQVYGDLCTESQSEGNPLENLRHFRQGAMLGYSQPFARTDTYNEMLATGNINLIEDTQIRTFLLAYLGENETLMRRTQTRVTDYPALMYQLVPSMQDISESEAADLWANVKSLNICNSVRAEQNFGVFIRTGYAEWKERQNLFLHELTVYLDQIR